jgi:anti-anti-sigma factor
MIAPAAIPSVSLVPSSRAAIVIDLIGDVDALAARSFGEAVDRLADGSPEPIVLSLLRVAALHASGVTVLASTIAERRRRGIAIDVVADGRRVRVALQAARVRSRLPVPGERGARLRHVMIVHNADPTRDCA